MTDWKALAAMRCPDLPDDAIAAIVPSLVKLEDDLRPLKKQLTALVESSVTFRAECEK